MKRRRAAKSVKNARSLSLNVLLECGKHQAYVQEILDKHLKRSSLSNADRRLATQLVYGVLRRQITLDALLQLCVQRPRDKVQPWVWETMRLGVYQLALLSQIPPHAAIHETVELAATMGQPRTKGFINGVLRSVSTLLTDETISEPNGNALPLEEHRYRRLNRDILPDPTTDPVAYLSAGFGLPQWLVKRWLDRYGWDRCIEFGFWFNAPAPIWLRCNILKTNRDALLGALTEAGIQAEPGDQPQSIRLSEHIPITALPGYEEGWFSVQDLSAMSVAHVLAPEPGSRVLDLCAAPGGKTSHLAELMHNEGEIIACDIDRRRLEKVDGLCRRLGIDIVKPFLIENDRLPDGEFDAVLVDAPCSNTGVLGRRPEIRRRLKPKDLAELVQLQTQLLGRAVQEIKPGGHIVYSTCSIEPEENRGVVDTISRLHSDLKLDQEVQHLPGDPADGGYWARLTCVKEA